MHTICAVGFVVIRRDLQYMHMTKWYIKFLLYILKWAVGKLVSCSSLNVDEPIGSIKFI